MAHGIKSTAGVVTSAAVVMVSVFAIFGRLHAVLQAVRRRARNRVLIDATIVRAMLLPATMKLLGDWNWYLPRWLEWLPRLDSYEPEVEAEPALVPTAEAKPARVAARKRRSRSGRITGLLLIGLVVLGLGYLRVSSACGLRAGGGERRAIWS